MRVRKHGDFLIADFFENSGGLNTADSPFRVDDSEATGGRNFEYALTGGFRKRNGATKVNSSADTGLKTLGAGQHTTASGTKTVIRTGDRKIQALNLSAPSFTNLTEDTTTAGSDILASSSTIPVVFRQFNTTSTNVLWGAGGGMSLPYGVYSSTKVTKNGVPVPTGTLGTPTVNAAGTGTFAASGSYVYAVVYRKSSTQALSNAALDKTVTLANATDTVTIDLTGLSNMDSTKYDKIYLYRTAVGGSADFTTGTLVAQINSNATSYTDTGSSLATAQNVPRSGNTVLDNAELPAGTYKTLAVWKRRLVTASDSTLYFSDLNKAESWPAANTITIPSGGPITGLHVISYTTATTSSIDEILVVFKERELWVVTGSTASDWSLKYIDAVGCPNQSLGVYANGYLAWMDYRGVYLWDGAAKPIFCSRKIQNYFDFDGLIDFSKMAYGWGEFHRIKNQILWVISGTIEGEQKLGIKMDLRLTIPAVQSSIGGRVIDAVFAADVLPVPLYGGASIVPETSEIFLAGDASGYVYKLYDNNTYDFTSGTGTDFQFETKFFDFGTPGHTKRYHKVIAWVQEQSDENLTLEYWTRYKSGIDESSTLEHQISQSVSESLWDLASWDAVYWDNSVRAFNPVVFNLNSFKGANEGDCLKLKFEQTDANVPLTIAGFSVVFTEVALRK